MVFTLAKCMGREIITEGTAVSLCPKNFSVAGYSATVQSKMKIFSGDRDTANTEADTYRRMDRFSLGDIVIFLDLFIKFLLPNVKIYSF